MVRCKSLLGAVAVVLMVSLVSAQGQPRGRGRGGFGGRGGGGMFGGPSALLRMPEVRKELATTDEQNKEIDAALEQAAPAGGGFGNFQNLSDEERTKAFEEMRKKGEETDAKIKKILKPDQVTRLDQLALQRQGVNALTRPEVVKQLSLTQEQQDKIQKTLEEARAPGGGAGGGFQNFQNLSDEERQKLRAEAEKRREKTESDVVAVLTDEQKTKWAEMKGKKFDFPAFGGPGGGGRGPGGAGGERRRPPTKE